MKKTIIIVTVSVILGVLAAELMMTPPPDIRAAREVTDKQIRAAASADEAFKREVAEIIGRVETKVVNVREKVRGEIQALPPDGVAYIVVEELSMFRRRDAGTETGSRPPWVHGE